MRSDPLHRPSENHPFLRSGVLLGLATTLLTAAPTLAQDALNRDLQRDLGVTRVTPQGSAGFNRDQIWQQELRFRNAIITGNVPGLSFRDDVGYTSPFEFRGALSGDDNFAFRRDSLVSGLGGTGLRGTDALQYQFGLTTGTRLPGELAGSFTFNRDGNAFGANPGGASRVGSNAVPTSQVGLQRNVNQDAALLQRPAFGDRLDALEARSTRSDADLPELRSLAAYNANAPLRTDMLGRRPVDDSEDRVEVTSSPLTGLRYRVVGPDDAAGARVEAAEAGGQAVDLSVPPSVAQTAYADLLERLEQFGSTLPPPEADEDAPPTAQTSDEAEIDEFQQRLEQIRERLKVGEEEAIEAVRGEAEVLVEPPRPEGDPAFDWYAEHMRRGQEKLAEGRYFEAEGRFTSALGVRRGDILAQVGRVNAQLGAGMLLSASVNLRTLLDTAPEIAPTRFGAEVMPKPERSVQLVELLGERLGGNAGGNRAGFAVGTDPALLLAYLGFQMRNAAAVGEGLSALEEQDPLRPLLYRAWGAPIGIDMPSAPLAPAPEGDEPDR
ncbi:MAG: hypothetical protein AAGB51_05665 [Planctomycetota bacterium]